MDVGEAACGETSRGGEEASPWYPRFWYGGCPPPWLDATEPLSASPPGGELLCFGKDRVELCGLGGLAVSTLGGVDTSPLC